MRYLCLVYLVEDEMAAMPAATAEACTRECLAYDKELREGGHYIASNALQPVRTATTLRVRNGKLSMTDGPFAETKEQLGGFILVEAKDLNEAIRLAAQMPMAKRGSIEVRPVMTLPGQEVA